VAVTLPGQLEGLKYAGTPRPFKKARDELDRFAASTCDNISASAQMNQYQRRRCRRKDADAITDASDADAGRQRDALLTPLSVFSMKPASARETSITTTTATVITTPRGRSLLATIHRQSRLMPTASVLLLHRDIDEFFKNTEMWLSRQSEITIAVGTNAYSKH